MTVGLAYIWCILWYCAYVYASDIFQNRDQCLRFFLFIKFFRATVFWLNLSSFWHHVIIRPSRVWLLKNSFAPCICDAGTSPFFVEIGVPQATLSDFNGVRTQIYKNTSQAWRVKLLCVDKKNRRVARSVRWLTHTVLMFMKSCALECWSQK